jgi:hypothetical protein
MSSEIRVPVEEDPSTDDDPPEMTIRIVLDAHSPLRVGEADAARCATTGSDTVIDERAQVLAVALAVVLGFAVVATVAVLIAVLV